QDLYGAAAKRDVRKEIERAVAARGIKLQLGISREDAATDVERTVCAEHARFEHIGVSKSIIECDRSIALDERKERPANIITAPVNIDRRAPDRSVAPIDRNRRIIGHRSAARNIHVNGRATLRTRADAAPRVIDLSNQRIRSNVCCVYVDRGIATNGSGVILKFDVEAVYVEIVTHRQREIAAVVDLPVCIFNKQTEIAHS